MQKSLNLSDIYKCSVDELREQQRKRDQLLGFFITLIGALSSIAFIKDHMNYAVLIVFIFLYIMGFFFALVIIRYKILRDKLVITTVVLQKLMTVSQVTPATIRALFRQQFQQEHAPPKSRKLLRYLFRAETLMYLIFLCAQVFTIIFSLYVVTRLNQLNQVQMILSIVFTVFYVILHIVCMMILFYRIEKSPYNQIQKQIACIQRDPIISSDQKAAQISACYDYTGYKFLNFLYDVE